MCFLFGGLRFREQVSIGSLFIEYGGINIKQIYNSTVTQMSACLLSLSVMSLLLPVSCLVSRVSFFCLVQDKVSGADQGIIDGLSRIFHGRWLG